MLALMIENVHLVRIEEDATRLVSPPRIVRPTVPKTSNDGMEFSRPPVPFVVPDMAGQPEIERCVRVGGRDDIPSRAAIADVVERCETASDMVRRVNVVDAVATRPIRSVTIARAESSVMGSNEVTVALRRNA